MNRERDDISPDAPTPELPDASEQPALHRRVVRFVLLAIGFGVGFFVVLLLLFFLALQTNWGSARFGDFIFGLANPYNDATTHFDEIGGNFITHVELRNLRMTRVDTFLVDTLSRDPLRLQWHFYRDLREEAISFDAIVLDTVHLFQIDTFRVRYNLLSLLRRRVHLTELTFAGPDIRMHQRADSSWDVIEPFRRERPDTLEETRLFTFQVDSFRITDGSVYANFYPPWDERRIRVEDINVQVRDLVERDHIDAVLDTLTLRYTLPDQDYWTDVDAGGSFYDNRLTLTGLRLSSPQSLVTGVGTLRLPDPDDPNDVVNDVDFSLRADPVAFADLRLFAPDLIPEHSATLDVRVRGSGRLLQIDASGTLSDGASLDLEGRISPLTEGPLEYAFEGNIRRFDPRFFTTRSPSTPLRLNADLRVDLRGTELRSLDGTVAAELFDSRIGRGMIDRSTLQATFTDGLGRITSRTVLGGSVINARGTARPFDDVPSYDLEGGFTRFDVGLFAEDQRSNLNGTFRVDGYGIDPQHAELTGRLTFAPSTFNDYEIREGAVAVGLSDGLLAFDGRMLFPDGHLYADGEVRFRDPLTYSVRQGRFENVDLAALLGRPEASSINGTFTLSGTGTDPQTLGLRARLALSASRFGHYQLADGSANLTLRQGLLRLDAVADLIEAGSFDFALATRPFQDLPTLDVTRLIFRNVDLGALTQNPGVTSNLTGRGELTIRGFEPETMRLDGRITLSRSRLNEQVIESGAVTAQLRRGTLNFDGNVDLPEGNIAAAGTSRPFLRVPTYTIRQGRFSGIDLGAFTGQPRMESDLSGTFTLEGRGFDPETLVGEGRFDFDASRINEQQINDAQLEGRWEGGTFDFSAYLLVPEGETRLTGTMQPLLDTPTYVVREGTFAGINLGALAGEPDWQTNLSGTIALEGRGFDPETLSLTAEIEFGESVINDARLLGGQISANVEGGYTRLETDLNFESGTARMEAAGRLFDDPPTYTARGSLADIDLADILGNDTLVARFTVDFDVEGTGFDPETMTISGVVSSRDTRFQEVEVDTLFSRFELTRGLLRADTLVLRSSMADIEGAGQIALFDPDTTYTSDFTFLANVYDISALRPFVGAEALQLETGRIEGRVYGRPGTIRFDITGDVRSFVYNEIRLGRFEGRLAGELGPDRELRLAETTGTFDVLSFPGLLVRDARFDVQYQENEIHFTGEFTIDERRGARVSGVIDMRLDVQQMLIEDLTLRLDDDVWELLQPATITYGDAYRIRNLLLYSGDQQIAIDGVIDPGGEQNLVVTIESFRLAAVADLLGYEGLAGTLDGSLVVTGPAYAPIVDGTLDLDIESRGQDVGEMRLLLQYDDLAMNVDALLTHVDEGTLTIEGMIPMDLRLRPGGPSDMPGPGVAVGTRRAAPDSEVDLVVVADSFSIGWLQPFLNPEDVDRFEGRLTGRFDVGGTLNNPLLAGEARFVNGLIGMPTLGTAYSDIHADFDLAGNEVQVRNAVMTSGRGRMTAQGTINLQELTLGEFNIRLRADQFRLVDTAEYSAIIDGNLQLSGTTRAPVLSGNVEIISGEVFLTEERGGGEVEDVQLSDRDILVVERRFGIRVTEEDTTLFDIYGPLTMDLNVRVERNTWLRSRANPVMDIQFSGNLELRKRQGEDVQVFGTIEVVPQHSRIVQFGKRFELTSGTLTFNGPATDPIIDIEAEYKVPTLRTRETQVTITLAAEGSLENLDLTLGSSEPLEMTDIISYLATGRPADESLQLSGLAGEAFLGTGGVLALEQLRSFVEGIASEGLGLDVVEIEQTGLSGAVITVGQYVTNRLFVSVSQPISFGQNPVNTLDPSGEQNWLVTVEYEVVSWLLLRLVRQGSIIRINLRWQYAY